MTRRNLNISLSAALYDRSWLDGVPAGSDTSVFYTDVYQGHVEYSVREPWAVFQVLGAISVLGHLAELGSRLLERKSDLIGTYCNEWTMSMVFVDGEEELVYLSPPGVGQPIRVRRDEFGLEVADRIDEVLGFIEALSGLPEHAFTHDLAALAGQLRVAAPAWA